jgi:hypothetical protein
LALGRADEARLVVDQGAVMAEVVTIVCLGDREHMPLVDRAAELLNRSQQRFVFQVLPEPVPLPQVRLGVYPWDALESLLARVRADRSAGPVLGVLTGPIENNWFSRTNDDLGVAFITTYGWEYLCALPVAAYVAFEIVENLGEIHIGEFEAHDETRGCVADMCAHKPDIAFKIRTADICDDCTARYLCSRPAEDLAAMVAMLEEVRRVALGRAPTAPGLVGTASRAERVDREYPFPLAYCFRSMQVELSYTRKWLKLLELHEVAIRYLTLSLLAAVRVSGHQASAVTEALPQLGRATLGKWHQAGFALMRQLREDADQSFLRRFLTGQTDRLLKSVAARSLALVEARNDTKGHGNLEGEAGYQRLFEQHQADLNALLDFVAPLASYPLLHVGEGLRRRAGVSRFPAKRLMGSHPIFPVESCETREEVDTDCLLFDPPSGRYLSLYPFVLFDHCPACFRETVFVYDRMSGQGVCLREYPTNHRVRKPDARLPAELAPLFQPGPKGEDRE